MWLELAKERIECVLHNGDNPYLRDALKFIDKAMLSKQNKGSLATDYHEVQMNSKEFERGIK